MVNTMHTQGLVIGRFLPFHMGHSYLIEFAQNNCSELVVILCSTLNDEIAAPIRLKWIKETFPQVSLIHSDKEIPDAHRGNPHSPKIWAYEIQKILKGEGIAAIDLVFTSEEYGAALAAHMNAREIMVDPHRNVVPISATRIRQDPFACWDHIPRAVKKDLVQVLGVRGEVGYYERLVAEHLATRYIPDAALLQDLARTEVATLRAFGHKFVLVYLGNDGRHFREEEECSEILVVNDDRSFVASSQRLGQIAQMNFVSLLNNNK